MINPSNEFLVESIVRLVVDLDHHHNALLFDVYIELKKIRDKYGDEYPRCGTCYRPADGVSKGCAECYSRHPNYYIRCYGEYQ